MLNLRRFQLSFLSRKLGSLFQSFRFRGQKLSRSCSQPQTSQESCTANAASKKRWHFARRRDILAEMCQTFRLYEVPSRAPKLFKFWVHFIQSHKRVLKNLERFLDGNFILSGKLSKFFLFGLVSCPLFRQRFFLNLSFRARGGSTKDF